MLVYIRVHMANGRTQTGMYQVQALLHHTF